MLAEPFGNGCSTGNSNLMDMIEIYQKKRKEMDQYNTAMKLLTGTFEEIYRF